MKKQWLLVVVALLAGFLLGLVACADTPEADAQSRVSDFVIVGQRYWARCSGGGTYSFTVSEIVNDSWVAADTEYGSGWLNISQLVFVRRG